MSSTQARALRSPLIDERRSGSGRDFGSGGAAAAPDAGEKRRRGADFDEMPCTMGRKPTGGYWADAMRTASPRAGWRIHERRQPVLLAGIERATLTRESAG
jgi:hypothetical protein